MADEFEPGDGRQLFGQERPLDFRGDFQFPGGQPGLQLLLLELGVADLYA